MIARRRGPPQAIVQSLAQAFVRNRHHRDRAIFLPVESAEHREQVRRCLHDVSDWAQIQFRRGSLDLVGAKGKQRLARLHRRDFEVGLAVSWA